MEAAVIDFETKEIEPRPHYPPEPVGVAIAEPGRRPEYLAWGHPTANNTTKTDATRRLREIYRKKRVLFFHAKYDLDVGNVHLGLPILSPERFECAMIAAFLCYPNRRNLQLKTLAEDLLGVPPDESDALREYLIQHHPKVTKATKDWGRYIADAPGMIVAPYAIGDVTRPRDLMDKKFWPYIEEHSMKDAYHREKRFAISMLVNERRGIPVSERRLISAEKASTIALDRTDDWIRKRLRAPELDIDKRARLADAIEEADKVEFWNATKKGNRSTNAESIRENVTDRVLVEVLDYRAKLATYLRTFIRPWRNMAVDSGGLIYTIWNTVKGDDDSGGRRGARTGRLSSNPNLQNVPRTPPVVVTSMKEAKPYLEQGTDVIMLPVALARTVGQLPDVRSFIVPREKGQVLFDRDYNQHELRLLAYYENDRMLKQYQENPRLDLHRFAQVEINSLLGTNFARKPVKNTGFGIIYGAGLSQTARMTGTDVDTARTLRRGYREILPGLRALETTLRKRAKADDPIRTWGGRVYYVEEPIVIEGRIQTFEYKMLNTLIQGSAADCLKEAWLRYEELPAVDDELYLTVHDEYLGSVPRKRLGDAMVRLQEAMESLEFDVPILSDGKWSAKNWGEMKGYDDPKIVN